MPRVTEAYREERRERILAAAARCFARAGFHSTSMDDVIAEVGLSSGAVYGYYRGKDELIEAVARRAMEFVAEALPEVGMATSPADLLERLLSLMARLAEGFGFDPARVAIQAWGEAARNPAVHQLVRDGYRAVRAAIAEAVPAWQRDGLVAADADPEDVAKLLFGTVPGYIVQRQVLGDVRPDRYAAALRALGPATPS